MMQAVGERFCRDGFLVPTAFFVVDEPKLFESVTLTGEPQTFLEQMQAYALHTGAHVVMHAYEVWMRGALDDEHRRGYERGLASHPEAREQIVVLVEARAAAITRAWIAPIVRRAAGGARLDPFAETNAPRVDGWFTQVFE